MAIALVGFDVDPHERLYGISNATVSQARYDRNVALKRGTYRLYQAFLDAVEHLDVSGTKAEADCLQVAKVWETMLIPLVWRNSQTRTPTYEGLLPHSRLYWEGNLAGFSWPAVTPTTDGIWAPLGTFGYYYFHYGVSNYPDHILGYVNGALSLYWLFVAEQFGTPGQPHPDLSYLQPPAVRWQRLKRLLGWEPIDYHAVAELLSEWLQDEESGMQFYLRQSFLTEAHWRDLEWRLLMGEICPGLIGFLAAYRAVIEEALSQEDKKFEWRFDWPVSERWKLGPGGLQQALLAFFVEGLVKGVAVLANLGGVSYGSFLSESTYQPQRQALLEHLSLSYDALEWLGGTYRDVKEFQPELFLLLVELLGGGGKLDEQGAYRLDGQVLDLETIVAQLPQHEQQVDLSPLRAYPEATASLVVPNPFDRIRLVNPPQSVESGSLELLKVEGRPGTAILISVLDFTPVEVYGVTSLIGEDGYGYIPVIFDNPSLNPSRVNVVIKTLEADYIRTNATFIVRGKRFNLQTILPKLPGFKLAAEKPALVPRLETYLITLPKQHRQETKLLNLSGAPARSGQTKSGGGGSNLLGLMSSLLQLFQKLGRTNPVSTPDKQQNKQEQKSHAAAALDAENKLTTASDDLERGKDKVQPKTEAVAPTPMQPTLQEYKEAVVPDAGKATAAAAVARAQDASAGRTLIQSNEVWQVSSQHARVHTTGNFEVSAPTAVLSNQVLSLQARHRVGIHDLAQDTAQFLWYRATKQRQMVAEHNLDYNNNWYKATSANAHYVAGHHVQYGDELILRVGETKKNEETDETESAEDVGEENNAEATVEAEEAKVELQESVDSAQNLSSAQTVLQQARDQLNSILPKVGAVNQMVGTIGSLTGGTGSLGALGSALTNLSGSAGGITNAIQGVISSIPSTFDSLTGLVNTVIAIKNLVDAVSFVDENDQPLPDSQIATILDNLDSQLESLLNTALGYLAVINAATTSNTNVTNTAVSAAQQFVNQLTNGTYNSSASRNKYSPYLTVIAGAGVELLGQALGGNVVGGLSGVLGSLGTKVGSLVSSVIGSVVSRLGMFTGLGSLGNLSSLFNASSLTNLASNFQNAATQFLNTIPGLGAIGNVLGVAGPAMDALGLGNMPKLHQQNSQVQKYGHYLIQVYKELALEVKRGGFRVKAKKDIGFTTRTGHFQAQALRMTMMSRLSTDVGSRFRTNLRGRIVTVKADKVLYLDAPKIICSTLPVVGSIPAIAAVSSIMSQLQELAQKVESFAPYIDAIASMIGGATGDGIAAPMQSPEPVQTGQGPKEAVPRPLLADQNPTGGATPAGIKPPEPIPTTSAYSPQLVRHFYGDEEASA